MSLDSFRGADASGSPVLGGPLAPVPEEFAYPRQLRRRRARQDEFVGAHRAATASHLSLADFTDHQIAEILILKQTGRGLREENLPTLGRVAQLGAADG